MIFSGWQTKSAKRSSADRPLALEVNQMWKYIEGKSPVSASALAGLPWFARPHFPGVCLFFGGHCAMTMFIGFKPLSNRIKSRIESSRTSGSLNSIYDDGRPASVAPWTTPTSVPHCQNPTLPNARDPTCFCKESDSSVKVKGNMKCTLRYLESILGDHSWEMEFKNCHPRPKFKSDHTFTKNPPNHFKKLNSVRQTRYVIQVSFLLQWKKLKDLKHPA